MKITSFVVSVSLAFIFLATAHNASGSILTEPLTVTIIESGSFDGVVGTGSFSYDDDFLMDGDEILDSTTSLELEFTIFGQLFTEDDNFSPALFTLDFENFVPSFLIFVIAEENIFDFPGEVNLVDIVEPGVIVIGAASSLSPAVGGGFDAAGEIIAVPEPSSIVLWATIGLAALTTQNRGNKKRNCSRPEEREPLMHANKR